MQQPERAHQPHALLQLLLDYVVFRVVDWVAPRVLGLLFVVSYWVLAGWASTSGGAWGDAVAHGVGSVMGGVWRLLGEETAKEVSPRVWYLIQQLATRPVAWAIYLWSIKLLTGRTFAQWLLKSDGIQRAAPWGKVVRWLTFGASAPSKHPPSRTRWQHPMLALGLVSLQLWLLHTLFLA